MGEAKRGKGFSMWIGNGGLWRVWRVVEDGIGEQMQLQMAKNDVHFGEDCCSHCIVLALPCQKKKKKEEATSRLDYQKQ